MCLNAWVLECGSMTRDPEFRVQHPGTRCPLSSIVHMCVYIYMYICGLYLYTVVHTCMYVYHVVCIYVDTVHVYAAARVCMCV